MPIASNAEIGVSRPVIEVAPPVAEAAAVPVPPVAPAPAEPIEPKVEQEETSGERRSASKAKIPAKTAQVVQVAQVGQVGQVAQVAQVAPVIPLVHAPDDPGLDLDRDAGLDRDPVPEPSSPPPGDAWQRLRQLFR